MCQKNCGSTVQQALLNMDVSEVVELAAFRFGFTVEPVSGCAWRMLVQEGLAGAGCAGLAIGESHGVGELERVVSWGMGRRLILRRRN